jgi:hypothetical protein
MDLVKIPQTMLEYLLDINLNKILKDNDTVTTLELKELFRKNYNGIYIDQAMVSNFLNDNYTNYDLHYVDNGIYRIYTKNNVIDNEYYMSATKGRLKIADMNFQHLENALVKLMKEQTGLSKSDCRNILEMLLEKDSDINNLFNEYISRHV